MRPEPTDQPGGHKEDRAHDHPHPQPVYGFRLSRINATVIAVLVAFAYLYCVDVLLIIVPWLSYSVPGVTNLGVLTITTAMALYCYMFCVVLDPGRVPHDWHPDEENLTVTEVKRKDGAPRFCQKCQKYKPARTHHCRVCNRCVLRMDHHCPWTNNCIGHANYRAFMLFLIHVSAALVHTVGLICAHVLHVLQTSQEQRVIRTGPTSDPVQLQEGWYSRVWVYVAMQTLAFALSLPLCVGLLMLLAWHMHLIAANKTTIEYQEGVRSSIQAYPGAPLYEHPYDLGLCTNLHETLGDSAMEWCMPPCAEVPGGTRYRTLWDERALGLPDF